MENEKEVHLNPHIFFFFNDNQLVLWDCLNHQQWEISTEYIDAISSLKQGKAFSDEIKAELLDAGIISHTPFEELDWGWDALSRFYHLGVSDIFPDIKKNKQELVEEYLNLQSELCQMQNSQEICEIKFKDSLPEDLQSQKFSDVLLSRKTTREFDGSSIDLEKVSSILYASCGEIHGEWTEIFDVGLKVETKRRSHPSGGGLYPFKILLLSLHVDGLKEGVYEYIPKNNGLKIIQQFPQDIAHLIDVLCSQFYEDGIAAGIVLVPDFAKEWIKYPHSRSYRDVFLDIGHCSQSILMCATALNVKTWITAAFKDKKLAEIMKIDNPFQFPVCFIGIGNGSDSSLPCEFKKQV